MENFMMKWSVCSGVRKLRTGVPKYSGMSRDENKYKAVGLKKNCYQLWINYLPAVSHKQICIPTNDSTEMLNACDTTRIQKICKLLS